MWKILFYLRKSALALILHRGRKLDVKKKMGVMDEQNVLIIKV